MKKLNGMLEKFTALMHERLEQKKAAGFEAWDDADSLPDEVILSRMEFKLDVIAAGLAAEKDYADLANFAAFLWWRKNGKKGQPTA